NYTGPGFLNGIYLGSFSSVPNIHVTGISVNGCLNEGNDLANTNTSQVDNCIVSTVGGNGIVAQHVTNSTADNCGFEGIEAFVAENCTGRTLSTNSSAVNATNASNCYALA